MCGDGIRFVLMLTEGRGKLDPPALFFQAAVGVMLQNFPVNYDGRPMLMKKFEHNAEEASDMCFNACACFPPLPTSPSDPLPNGKLSIKLKLHPAHA